MFQPCTLAALQHQKGQKRNCSSSIKHPISAANDFLQRRFQAYVLQEMRSPLRSASLREKRQDQKKSQKFQLSDTQLPRTRQSTCQSIPQQSLFLIKFFDSHEFPVYLFVWCFFPPSLSLIRGVFPKLQLPRSKMFARFCLSRNTFPGVK